MDDGECLKKTTKKKAGYGRAGETHKIVEVLQFPAYIANAGVEWNRYRVVIRPEVRYTRWDNTKTEPGRRRDQVAFLIGFSVR